LTSEKNTNELIILLFNSLNLKRIKEVRDLLKDKINEIVSKTGEDYVKKLIFTLIENNEVDDRTYCNYFENEDLNEFLISFLDQCNFNIGEIFQFSKYFIKKEEEYNSPRSSNLFLFYSNKFINILYPIISSPEEFRNNFHYIQENIDIIKKLDLLGHPIKHYKKAINDLRTNFLLERRLL